MKATCALFVICFAWLGALAPAQACLYADEAVVEPLDALVKRSSRIVLGDVVSLTIKGDVRVYTVNVVEKLKGQVADTLTIRMRVWDPEAMPGLKSAFGNDWKLPYSHAEPGFWLGRYGAGVVYPTCEVLYAPSRGRYLIFMDQPHHVRAFEPIADADDLWYVTTKRIVNDPSVKGRSVGPIEFLKMFDSVYLYECRQPRHAALGKVYGVDRPPTAFTPDFYGTPYFAQGNARCARDRLQFLALFLGADDNNPIALVIDGDRVKFARRYGDMVMTVQELPLEEVRQQLR